MKAKYTFQCRLTGQYQSATFIDKENETIEDQAKKFSKSTNQEIINYTFQ